MSFNLMETVKNHFTSEFTNQASSTLGESSSGISKALTAIIPAGLAAILSKSTSGTEGANSIFNIAKDAASKVSENTSAVPTEGIQKGSSLAASLFGANQSGIVNGISKFAGIKDSSASSLMSMGLPAIFGVLGKYSEQNNLSASGLSGFLSSQKDHIMQAMPSGSSSLAGMLGLDPLDASSASLATNATSEANKAIEEIKDESKGNNWFLPLVFVVIAIGLLLYFSKSCGETRPSTAADKDTTSFIQKTETPSLAMVPIGSVPLNSKLSFGK
jgi:hypothetical protein